MLISREHVTDHPRQIGRKAINLQLLIKQGYRVPDFLVIPANIVVKLINENNIVNQKMLQEIVSTALGKLNSHRFALRSAVLIEDKMLSSEAGRFTSLINLSADEIIDGLIEILIKTNTSQPAQLKNLSIMIQEFVIPEISGVTFTRNPITGREMVIEYFHGLGDELVSGLINPSRERLLWDQNYNIPKIPDSHNTVNAFKQIESYFHWPQDIEWCFSNGWLVILQTRPITTITKQDYRSHLYLDHYLTNRNNYYYTKDELCEIAPRPMPFTLSLLKHLYEDNGPVAEIYRSYGLYYRDQDFFKIIGNELFLDKEKELHSLLPGYTYKDGVSVPEYKLGNIINLIISRFNIYKVNKAVVEIKSLNRIKEHLISRLQKPDEVFEISDLINNLIKDYRLVFEISLLYDKWLRLVSKSIASDEITLTEILDLKSATFPYLNYHQLEINQEYYRGNSIALEDESPFLALEFNYQQQKIDELLSDKLPKQVRFYNNIINISQYLSYLKELARWLSVKNISRVRLELLDLAKNFRFNNLRDIYYCNLDEILSLNIKETTCTQRRKHYLQYNNYRLPSVITPNFSQLERETELLAVSEGSATGKLVTVDQINHEPGQILYSKFLQPELSTKLSFVSGIISENGGLLSHLAIIARERKIPIITNFNITQFNINIGDKVRINSSGPSILRISD